jgi:DNA-binding NarL/FixJ family response regulator
VIRVLPLGVQVVRSPLLVDVALGLSDRLRCAQWVRELGACGGVGEVTLHHGARAAVEWAASVELPRVLVVVALAELGGGEVEAIAASGVSVLLVVDDVAGVDLGRVTGVRSAGVVDGRDCDAAALGRCLAQIRAGQVPLPPQLARRLLAPGRHKQDPSPAPRLTPREHQALVLLVEGLSNKQIARRLTISEHGAKRLVGNIMAKLDAPNRTCAVTRALRQGLHHPTPTH